MGNDEHGQRARPLLLVHGLERLPCWLPPPLRRGDRSVWGGGREQHTEVATKQPVGRSATRRRVEVAMLHICMMSGGTFCVG